MTAKLTFKTTDTPNGPLHTMKITGGKTQLTQGSDFHLFPVKPAADYVAWTGPAYLADNGKAFRIGRNVAKGLIAWKTVKIGARFDQQSYRMRSSATYKGDYVTAFQRTVNGTVYDFSRVRWANGSTDVTVYAHGTTTILHYFTYPA